MKRLMWRMVALCLARWDWLRLELFERALDNPYTHIYGPQGLYMLRWYLIHPGKWFPWAVRFHQIIRPDVDRHLHDHPWAFTSLVLRGWYVEEYLDPETGLHKFQTIRAGDVNVKRRGEFHRISEVSKGGVTTMVIHGRRSPRSWGFLVGRRYVPHIEYFSDLDNSAGN